MIFYLIYRFMVVNTRFQSWNQRVWTAAKNVSQLYSHQHLIVLNPDGIITLSEGVIPKII